MVRWFRGRGVAFLCVFFCRTCVKGSSHVHVSKHISRKLAFGLFFFPLFPRAKLARIDDLFASLRSLHCRHTRCRPTRAYCPERATGTDLYQRRQHVLCHRAVRRLAVFTFFPNLAAIVPVILHSDVLFPIFIVSLFFVPPSAEAQARSAIAVRRPCTCERHVTSLSLPTATQHGCMLSFIRRVPLVLRRAHPSA